MADLITPHRLTPAVSGDLGDTRTVRLDGLTDLENVTAIEAHVWRTSTAGVVLAAAVVDATERTVRINLGEASGWLATAEPGTWFIEVEATFNDGSVLTFPSNAQPRNALAPSAGVGSICTIEVREQGA